MLLVYVFLYLVGKDLEGTTVYTLMCCHLSTFATGIIGFPIGISFAVLALPESSIGSAAILAIVAVLLSLISLIILCAVGMKKTAEDATTTVHNEEGRVQAIQTYVVAPPEISSQF